MVKVSPRKDVPFKALFTYHMLKKTGVVPEGECFDAEYFQKAPIYDIKPDSVADVTMNTPQLKDDSLSLMANSKIMDNATRQAAYDHERDLAECWSGRRSFEDPVDYSDTKDLTVVDPSWYDQAIVYDKEGNRTEAEIPDLKRIEDMDEFYQNSPPCPTTVAYNALSEFISKYGAQAVIQAMIETMDVRNAKDREGRAQTTTADDAKRVQDLLEYNEKKNPKDSGEPRITKYPNMKE